MASAPTLAEVLFPRRDVRFNTIIDELSEPESGPPADNFVSNEDSYPRVAGDLERRAPRGGVYLGVGPDQNFTFLAHCAPRLGIIVDFRRRNRLLHLLHKALISLSNDRASYLARLTARKPDRLSAEPGPDELEAAFTRASFDRERLTVAIAEVKSLLTPLKVVREQEWASLASIQAKLAGPGLEARFLALKMYPTLGHMLRTRDREGRRAHWLAHESTYQSIRTLQKGDLILPIVADFSVPAGLKKLQTWLTHSNLLVSVFYISDVEFFLMRNGRFRTYIDSLSMLPWHEEAVLIRTSTREIQHTERVAGDSSTTIVRRVASFLQAARQQKIQAIDDLFAAQ